MNPLFLSKLILDLIHERYWYQAETTPSQIRGTLTATYHWQSFITFGILFRL